MSKGHMRFVLMMLGRVSLIAVGGGLLLRFLALEKTNEGD